MRHDNAVRALALMDRRERLLTSRRRLMSLMLAAGVSMTAAACAGNNVNTTISTIAPALLAGLEAIGTEVSQILPMIQSVGANIPASTVSAIQTAITGIEAAVSGIGAASSASNGASILQTVETYINDLAAALSPFLSLIPGVGPIIGLIVAALPALEAVAGIIISLVQPVAAAFKTLAPPLPASARLKASVTGASQQYLNLLISKANTFRASHPYRR
jgi:hypothetical protein